MDESRQPAETAPSSWEGITAPQVATSQVLESTSPQARPSAKTSKAPASAKKGSKGPVVNGGARKRARNRAGRAGRASNIQLVRQRTPEMQSTNDSAEIQDGVARIHLPQAKIAKRASKLSRKKRKSKGLQRELQSILKAGGNDEALLGKRRLRARGAPSPEARPVEAKKAKDDVEVDDKTRESQLGDGGMLNA